jgi:hypothetical protein
MERGNTDWVTIPSKNLGRLSSITVHNDGTGLYPDWELASIHVSSAGFLKPDFSNAFEYKVDQDIEIDDGDTVNLPLVPNFPEAPPTIQCPGSFSVPNAPGLCDAVVTYSPVAKDECPGVTALTSPPSGTTLAVGTWPVSSMAKNSSGTESAPCEFTVTVQDVEPPVLACPAPIVVDATSPQGTPVAFAPTATDNCQVSTVTSMPPSNSEFPIGTTTVASEAVDIWGNVSDCSFTVHVKGAAEQTADLVDAVKNSGIKQGVEQALLVKLQNALDEIAHHDVGTACNNLGAFINQVAAQSGKAISAADAAAFTAAAQQIRAVLGC